jgi:UDP-N-acetylglucosamine acyltransferase
VVSAQAELGQEIEIGPFCEVAAGAVLGDGCRLMARASIKEDVTLGVNNVVGEAAVIGGRAQHVHNGPVGGRLVIGHHNQIREFCTMHRAFKPGDVTLVGDHNLFMVGAHVAHDCRVGSNIIVVNNALLGGHVVVEDRAFISGAVAIHQFCRVGLNAMVGGHTKIVQDVPPYVTVDGFPPAVVGVNKVGLRRAGYTAEDLQQLKNAYRLIYRRGLRWTEVLEALAAEFPTGPAARFREFFLTGTRGFTPERRVPRGATLKFVSPDEATNSDGDQSSVEAA